MGAFGHGVRRAARRRQSVGVPTAAIAGMMPASVAAAGAVPALHYHLPRGSQITSEPLPFGSTMYQAATSISDLRGLAAAVNTLGTGPLVMTDALGRTFLRFTTPASGGGPNGPNLLQIGSAFAAGQRAIAVFAVVRQHSASTMTYFSIGVAGSSPPNTGAGILNTSPTNTGACFLRGASRAASDSGLIAGAQVQAIGLASRATGQRLCLNGVAQNVPVASTNSAGTGATIGSYAAAPGNSGFDLYEMAVFTGELTDAQADAVMAALNASWTIPAVTDQIVIEGDSISAGVAVAGAPADSRGLSGDNLAMQLTNPGALLVPVTARVINQAVSGNTAANLVSRRDAAGSVFANGKLAGRNIVAVQIGRNSLTGDPASGTATYGGIVSLLNTPSTGYIQRGWEVVQALNIAVGSSFLAANETLRAALRSPQFATDTLTGAGQEFAGRLKLLDLPSIVISGDSKLDGVADASDNVYFQGDATHPTRLGTAAMANGGDIPQHGYGTIL